jgi:2-keto-3-deoxy-L-fuconate dehydrogenase
VEERSFPLITPTHNGLFRLDGKVAVVTGGASGIGRAIAELFATYGACVRILDLDFERAQEVAVSIRQRGGSAEARACDVAQHSAVQEIFQDILRETSIDVLVNNAGIAHIGNLESTTEEDFDRIYSVNVKGVFNCLSAALPAMKARRSGVILNMASIASSAGLPDRFAYSMSKGAVLSMTYSVARDYIAHNIRCNCISPARVFTPFVAGFVEQNYPGRESEIMDRLSHSQPIGRMAEPREVASLALYLCSDEAAFITGVDYPIDGGFFNIR